MIKKLKLIWYTSVFVMGTGFFLGLLLMPFPKVSTYFLIVWLMSGFVVYPGGFIYLMYMVFFGDKHNEKNNHGTTFVPTSNNSSG
jgi:hypothetical protein